MDHLAFSHQIVLCVYMHVFFVLCLGGVDKILRKGRIIVLISSRDFDSLLIPGENPLFLWRISILPCVYGFFTATVLVKRSTSFRFELSF